MLDTALQEAVVMPGAMSLGAMSTAWAQDTERDVDPEPDAADPDEVDADEAMVEDDYGDSKGERNDPVDARDFEPDEVLALDLSAEQIAQARTLGFGVREQLDLEGLGLKLHRLTVPSGLSVDLAIARLRAGDPRGDYERNSRYRLAGAQCAGVRCYGQQLVAPPPAAPCELAPRIAVLDTAVDVRHPALRQAHIQTIRIGAGPGSPAAHGTAVAAVLVGASTQGFSGLLPQARLFAADVFDTHGGRPVADAARLIAGLDWALRQHPDAVNLSLAGPSNPLLATAIQRITAQGVPVVSAAGNEGPRAAPQYPGAYPGVLAVTAVDRHLKPWARAAQGPHIALAAPGVAIWSADVRGDGRFHNGTSFASPFAAAAAAVIKQQSPGLNARQIADRLRHDARDLGVAGPDPVFGAGLVQLPRCR